MTMKEDLSTTTHIYKDLLEIVKSIFKQKIQQTELKEDSTIHTHKALMEIINTTFN